MKVGSNKHQQQKVRGLEELVSRLTKLGDKVLDPLQKSTRTERR